MPYRFVLTLVAVIVLVDIAWIGLFRPFAIVWGPVITIAKTCLLVLMARMIFVVIDKFVMAVQQKSILGSTIIPFFDALLLWLLISPATIVLAYLSVTFAPPFADGYLARIDTIIGFDPLALAAFFEQSPIIAKALNFAYNSFQWQIPAMVLIAVILGLENLSKYTFAFIFSLVFVIGCNMIWPAVGAYIHFGVDCGKFLNLAPWPACDFSGDVFQLRAGTFGTMDIPQAAGILTFPSFHTVVAILIIYFTFPIRVLRIPIFALNATMIISAVVIGGHYLADIIAGAVLAICAIWLTHWLAARIDAASGAWQPGNKPPDGIAAPAN